MIALQNWIGTIYKGIIYTLFVIIIVVNDFYCHNNDY